MSEHSNGGHHTKSLFDNVSPKFTFLFGIVVAIAVISTIGFYMMLANNLDETNSSSSAKNKNTNSGAVAGVTDPTPSPSPSPTPSAPAPSEPVPSGTVDLDGLRHVRGNGDIIIVEYSDIECPFCQRFHTTMQEVMNEYDGQVAWSYKHFPLTSIHPDAQGAAEASECAAEQGKFWEFVDKAFLDQSKLGTSDLVSLASTLGMNASDFQTCIDGGRYTNTVNTDAQEAQTLGGQGTPYSLVVNADSGEILDVISGAQQFPTVSAQLDSLLGS